MRRENIIRKPSALKQLLHDSAETAAGHATKIERVLPQSSNVYVQGAYRNRATKLILGGA